MSAVTVQQAFELALQHHQAGRLADAEALYRQVLDIQPNHVGALQLLGVVTHQTGNDDLAVKWIRQAIALRPDYAEAHNNLGLALASQGKPDEAVAAYRRAILLKPDSPEVHNNLGNALKDLRQLDDAVAAYRQALALKLDYPRAQNNLGVALAAQGRLDEALAAYRHALRLKTDLGIHSNLVYALHFHPDHDRTAIAEEQQRWSRHISEPLKQSVLSHPNARNPERRLRVGYVSPDFRDQVVGRNLRPLFRCHDHENFEILCYSGVARPDALTAEFQRYARQWRGTLGAPDEVLATMIRQDAVDILVDLSQHLAGNRLPVFALQPAPVQVSFAGYPESTGVEAINYRISDRWLESESGIDAGRTPQDIPQEMQVAGCRLQDDSERNFHPGSCILHPASAFSPFECVFLIDTFWCYDPCGVEVTLNELPALGNGYITFGCLNSFLKVNEPVLRLWAQVLGKVRDSRLILLSAYGSHRQRTLEILAREGIASHRVEFVVSRPRRDYLALYHRPDLALDPFPYNGHTTSLDAFWMGVPVVSLVGERPVSRAGWSQLSNMGLSELAAFSEDDYVRIAAQLAGDLPRLAELRATLRSRMEASLLMDAPRFTRQIEAAYRTMWRQWCAEKSS